jgi:type IV pilus assembly protein PilQ
VRSLLQVIADFTNFNIVTSDTVTGNADPAPEGRALGSGLDIIMDAKGLGMRKSGNVLWIAPKDEIDERTRRTSRPPIAKLEPLRTQSFQLNYAKAADMVVQLTTNSPAVAAAAAARTRDPVRARQRHRRAAHQPAVRSDTPAKLEEVRQLMPSSTCRCARC